MAAVALLAAPCGSCSAPAEQIVDSQASLRVVTVERELMKTRFRIDVVVPVEAVGRAAIEAAFAEVARSEEIFSNWSETSQISEVNRSAGVQPVVVSDELMAVLDRALTVSRWTDGAFDITFATCGGLWSIREQRIPSDEEIRTCLDHVDYRRVALDPASSSVFITDPQTRLGVAGLAKGYRVDRAAGVLERTGIHDYVVDGGGDMRVSGGPPGGSWQITVAHPRRSAPPLGALSITSGAIATSGDYQWFFERDGVRYHHILDPATGRPASRAVSATVIASTAIDADALATGLFVMGPEAGVALAERLDGVEALLIGPDLTVHTTSGFPRLAAPQGGAS